MKHYLKKLEEQVHLRADKPALCDYEGKSYTYAEMAAIIEQFHLFFQAAGIKKGDKIALCARNSARWAISFLAVNTYEAVIVPILADFTAEGAAKLVKHSDSILFIADPEIWNQMDSKQLPQLKGVISAREDALLWCSDPAIKGAWEEKAKLFDEQHPNGFNPQEVEYPANNDTLALMNYTSGTSGDPKGVMLSYNAMSDIVEVCQQLLSNTPDKLVSMLPLAHMYGLAMEFVYPCCTGFTIYFLGKLPSPSLLMKSMQEIQPSLMITVPLVMEKLYTAQIQPQLDTLSARTMRNVPYIRIPFYKSLGKKLIKDLGGRIQTIIIGGAPLSWKVESGFRKIGLPYAVGYGMTEACPLLSIETPDHFEPGSCGKPIHEIRIDSSDPERIPGEIQTKGPNLTMGYYKNREADAKAWTQDGWFRTGDLGIMDENGNVFIKGRIKAIILSSSGQNIYPEEVEQELAHHPLVGESLVLDRGGKVIALVYPSAGVVPPDADEQGHNIVAETIRTETNSRLPVFSQIFRVELVDIPFERTAKGSIKRHLYQ
ncbi:MAG: AMP-binding protein [Bacteroidales bacterium]|nr:AMP-binding protein [Bacteroidales bacterium]